MTRSSSSLKAILGPTNTGKTHFAIERMLAHRSGMIGLPLRLLAREVYHKVANRIGAQSVALVTGEERIVPPRARYWVSTVEAMPLDVPVECLAVDEIQVATDFDRGHIFTHRILNARGMGETLLLGAATMAPVIRRLLPDAEIVYRPRFSQLTYAGPKKLSRQPQRSAIVAFSASQVYAIAELLRRERGGAAVVMGALSPRTRNAQVAMFQAGEVDYLVATDAIGMGLNMDVAHVAFASLTKFDGRRTRRLTVAEMAQIAGRAGRHQRDGTFGALVEDGPGAFTPDEVFAIEEHRFPTLDHLYWRDGAPDLSSIDALIASLEARSDNLVLLRTPPENIDLAVLKKLADEPWVRARVRMPAMVGRLWAACGLPDFRKLGVETHSRFVGRVFGHLSEGRGHLPQAWFAEEIARLDTVVGDVETIAGRIAAARSWAYIAHRGDWLADPLDAQDRARRLEEKLSDALHDRLTQRFVDKRTTALLRTIGADASHLPVAIADDGAVTVEDHPIGRLDGFRFTVTPDARASDKRLLLAAAEKRLAGELARRGKALAVAEDDCLTLAVDGIVWLGARIATLAAGPALARPRILLDRSLDRLDRQTRDAIADRLARWLAGELRRHVPGLVALDALARDAGASGDLRATAAALADRGGIAERALVASVESLDPGARKRLRAAGITVGTLDLFDPRLLKPAAAAWRARLLAARGIVVAPPPPGATAIAAGTAAAGFRRVGDQQIRIDLVERIARAAHDSRAGRVGRGGFAIDPALAAPLGIRPATLDLLLTRLGFYRATGDAPLWLWRGRPRLVSPRAPKPLRDNAFAALAAVEFGNG